MANKHKIAEPIYQKIAIDIASKIAAGKYKAGEKIYGRSMLAAHYAVSPETIRRAMFMLQDVGIVAIEQEKFIFSSMRFNSSKIGKRQ